MNGHTALPRPETPPTGFRTLEHRGANPLRERIEPLEGLTLAIQHSQRKALINRGLNRLSELAQNRASDTCVVAGNGPSLNQVEWDRLDGIDVLAANYGEDHPELAPRITILSVVNPWVVSQRPEPFHDRSFAVAIPYYLAYWLPEGAADVAVAAHGHFTPALRIGDPLSTRSTVSYFNLQLALCLGYRKVIMVGFDHQYVQPAAANEGDHLQEGQQDPNHFSTGYFAGKTWQAADPQRMEIAYATASVHSQRRGNVILNCTSGSRLAVFPRLPLDEALRLTPPARATENEAKGSRISNLWQYVSAPRTAAASAGATLAALAAGVLGLAAGDTTISAAVLAVCSAAMTFVSVIMLNGSVTVLRQQAEDDWAEIMACLNRAKGHAPSLEHERP